MTLRPSSPTLTNPDLLLPGVDHNDFDHFSSQSHHDDSKSYSTMPHWHTDWFGSNNYQPNNDSSVRLDPTPIIYGNGTMLSDIGEVTEVETSPVKKKSFVPRLQKLDSYDSYERHIPAIVSPQLSYQAVAKRSKFGTHRREVSVESTDTIRTIEEPQSVEYSSADDDCEADDVASVGDSNFQGDDEQSVADSTYDHQLAYAQAAIAQKKEHVHQIMMGENTSSGALSRRAEAILAHAKKRLDSMEGNLNRARNTHYLTPSSSMNSMSSPDASAYRHSTPNNYAETSRTNTRQTSPLSPNFQSTTQALQAQTQSPLTTTEDSEHSTPFTRSFRPTSAVGGADFVNSDMTASRDSRSGGNAPHALKRQSTRLSSGATTPSGSPRDAPNIYQSRSSPPADSYLQPYGDQRGLSRSASSMQMRELTEKMRGLKGKISDLRERAKEDSLRRASMQSLRTPSPFTSNGWKNTSPRSDDSSEDSRDSPTPMNQIDEALQGTENHSQRRYVSAPLPQTRTSRGNSHGNSSGIRHVQSNGSINSHYVDHNTDSDSSNIISGYAEEAREINDSQRYDSESGASSYHDSVPTQVSHEDREDAFDYQHFFLHSAMGTLGAVPRERRGSMSSESSVETARATSPVTVASDHAPHSHLRSQASDVSISTIASFETANETLSPIKTSFDEQQDQSFFGNPPETTDDTEVISSADECHTSNASPSTDRPVTPVRQLTQVSAPEQEQKSCEEQGEAANFSYDGGSPTSSGVAHSMLQRQWTRESPDSSTRNTVRPLLGHLKQGSSVSSFVSSSGTTRSFPLVNKPKLSHASNELRPDSSSSRNTTHSSPTSKLSLYTDRASSSGSPFQSSPISALRQEYYGSDSRADSGNDNIVHSNQIKGVVNDPVGGLQDEDKKLVKALVASTGKCVLGLQGHGDKVVDMTMWRRRMLLARKILDGEEQLP